MKIRLIYLNALLISLFLVSCPRPVILESDKVITLYEIPGVIVPVRGETPIANNIDTAQYTGTITWSPVATIFAADTVYTANIVLTAKTGYTMNGLIANSFKVSGAIVTNADDSGEVEAVFPATENFSNNIGNLKAVPAGSFQRDKTASSISRLSAFWMSQCEITRAQFEDIMGYDLSFSYYSSGENDPVQLVNWYHAIAFCNRLSLREGLTPVYTVKGIDFGELVYEDFPKGTDADWEAAVANWDADGYRLPTEMEWMWAAMGADKNNPGVTNVSGYLKAFAGSNGNNEIGDYAVFGYNGYETGSTTTERSNPVGSKKDGANELGLYDMSGNVEEWCWDIDADYPPGLLIDYRGPASGSYHVVHGGTWSSYAAGCTISYKWRFAPYEATRNLGFRVVRY